MITCASVWVNGDRSMYNALWVARLHKMLARNITEPCRHVCLTDQPDKVPEGIVAIDLRPWWGKLNAKRGWWAKVALFTPKLFLPGERVLFCDLDMLIMGNLDGFLREYASYPMVMAPHTAPNFNPPGTINLYSSTVMLWTAPEGREIFEQFTPAVMKRLRGDQDWIGDVLPTLPTFDGRYLQRLPRTITKTIRHDALFVPCIKQKNDVAVKLYPWVKDIWKD